MKTTLIITNKTKKKDWDTIIDVLKDPLAKIERKLEIKHVEYDSIPREEINPGKWGVSLAFMSSLKPLAKGYETFIFHDPTFKVKGSYGWFNRSISTPTLAVKQVFRTLRARNSRYNEIKPDIARTILHEIIHAYCYTEGVEDETHHYQGLDNLLGYVDKLNTNKTMLHTLVSLLNQLLGRYKKFYKPDTPHTTNPYISEWALAIQEFEGWFPPDGNYPNGSRSYRNNNPGNLRWSPFESDNIDNFSVFTTYDAGLKALEHQLRIAVNGKSSVYNPEMTLIDFFNVYAPSSDNNHPEKYAKNIAKKLKVDPTYKIKNFIDV